MNHPDSCYDPDNSYEDDMYDIDSNYDDHDDFYSEYDDDDFYDDEMDGDHDSAMDSIGWGDDDSLSYGGGGYDHEDW